MKRSLRFIGVICGVLLVLLGHPARAGVYDDMLRAIEKNDNQKVIELLQRGMDVNTVDPVGNTLLAIAARNGNLQLVEFILNNRGNVLKTNRFGDSALMVAALKGHLPVVQALVAAGGKIEPEGWTPLIYAAFDGHTEVLRYLLTKGANINAQAPNGMTALMVAARNGHTETVRALLDSGTDPTLKNQKQETALSIAVRTGHEEVAELLRHTAKRAK